MQRERELLYTPFRADLVCVCLTQARLHKAWGVVPHKGHWKKRADMKSVIHFFCIFSYSSRIFSYVFCEFSFGDSLSLFYANFFISFPPFFFLPRLKERDRERSSRDEWNKKQWAKDFQVENLQRGLNAKRADHGFFFLKLLAALFVALGFLKKTRLCSTSNKPAFNCCVDTFRVLWLLMNCNECPFPLPAAAAAGLSTNSGLAEIDDKVYYLVSNIIWR